MLLPLNLDEDFVDKERITVTLVLAFQSPRIFGAKLDTPEADRLVADCDTAFSE